MSNHEGINPSEKKDEKKRPLIEWVREKEKLWEKHLDRLTDENMIKEALDKIKFLSRLDEFFCERNLPITSSVIKSLENLVEYNQFLDSNGRIDELKFLQLAYILENLGYFSSKKSDS